MVFPIRGRNWAFSSRWIDPSTLESQSSSVPSTFKELWNRISSSKKSDEKPLNSNVEVVVDFCAHKMNKAWVNLEKAPEGSFKSKLHGLGLKLLSRVKPSEIFLKSIPKDATQIEITYPSSLNARVVRRRLRHIAFRGTILHKKYFYGSVTLLPVTAFFAVLPLPNIPFFWILFRSYSHWRALKGSERLLLLVSDNSSDRDSSIEKENRLQDLHSLNPSWVFQPCDEFERLLQHKDADDSLSESTVSDICQRFKLNKTDVLKYRSLL